MLQLAADLDSFLNSTDITNEDVEAFLEKFSLSEGEKHMFLRQATDLLNKFCSIQKEANDTIRCK